MVKRAILITIFALCFFLWYEWHEIQTRYFLKLAMGKIR